jgi:hypothetical protein
VAASVTATCKLGTGTCAVLLAVGCKLWAVRDGQGRRPRVGPAGTHVVARSYHRLDTRRNQI